MYMNKCTLSELSLKMFYVYTVGNFDMTEYADCFNDLMTEYNFRYKDDNEFEGELLHDFLSNGGTIEDLFLDKINRMDINEKIFYNIAFEFIEPMKVEDHLLIPSLIPANF